MRIIQNKMEISLRIISLSRLKLRKALMNLLIPVETLSIKQQSIMISS